MGRKVYHASTREASDSGRSFISGARADMSKGNGQGQGFYVWTSLLYALNHGNFLSQQVASEPIIVELDAEVNPKDWTIDYEIHSGMAVKALKEHLSTLQAIPDRAVKTKRGKLLPSQSRISDLGTLVLTFETENGTNRTLAISDAHEKGTVGTAEALGAIFGYLQQFHPEKAYEMRQKWLADIDNITALRYSGKSPIPIVKLIN